MFEPATRFSLTSVHLCGCGYFPFYNNSKERAFHNYTTWTVVMFRIRTVAVVTPRCDATGSCS